MSGVAESLLGLLKLAPRLLFAVWVAGALVLLMPAPYAAQFGIAPFRDAHRLWVGPVTLGAFVVWATNLAVAGAGWTRRKFRRRAAAHSAREWALEQLATLSTDERTLLAYFVHRGAPTQSLVLNFAPARSLCAKGLLRVTPGSGNMFDWPYTVPASVWRDLVARRDTLFPGIDTPEARAALDAYPKRMREQNLFGGVL